MAYYGYVVKPIKGLDMNWELYSTRTVIDNRSHPIIHYCVYCRKEALLSEDWDRYEHYTYRYCTCPNGLKEREIELKLREMPKPDDKFVNSIKHRNEVHKLNCKYGIHK